MMITIMMKTKMMTRMTIISKTKTMAKIIAS